jgi:type II secretory pathway component PulM
VNTQEMRAELGQRWRDWRRNWEKLPATDRNLRTVGVALVLITLYAALIRPLTDNRIGALEYEMQKQAKRQKSSAKAETKPFVPPSSLGGKSPREAETELKALKEQFDVVDLDLRHLNASFVPLDDSLAMNALKSGLTSLAEAGDMEVTAIEHIFARREDKERVPTPKMLQEAASQNPFKRPLILLRARASFRGLMQFLDGLSQLPYVAAPVGCDISIEVERNPETKAPIRQWLDVRIKFAV